MAIIKISFIKLKRESYCNYDTAYVVKSFCVHAVKLTKRIQRKMFGDSEGTWYRVRGAENGLDWLMLRDNSTKVDLYQRGKESLCDKNYDYCVAKVL